jgi:hypothetical protein
MSKQGVFVLFDAQTTMATSDTTEFIESSPVIHAFIAGTGSVSATVLWFGNTQNTNTGGVLLATSTLSGSGADSTGATICSQWPYIYAQITAISGTSAAVTCRVSA